ncbi:Eco57I restriction-modification methylase domain-containing protein [Alistipes finegoldii]|uniref:Eco57I restriction-modification methylase domain-containing protein n=1 Tax=Alistipes finegoldii TaxID=214856 RepID=UPI0025B6F81D|nr:N-6 DNA methylase [Alistipes finegoldii]
MKSHLLARNNADLNDFLAYLNKKKVKLEIEDLIEFFEFVISPIDREVNGSVYTPRYIREYIINFVLSKFETQKLGYITYGDISCGCGGFFLTLVQRIHILTGISYQQLYANCIFGVDIKDYCISRTKLLLSLFAITDGEDIESFDFNLFVANSLNFEWETVPVIRERGGFDVIIGNPPYVGASKIDLESRGLLKKWSVAKYGKADLYIPFFQIALENLKKNGWLGYITVNNFYRSLNGRGVREYFSTNKFNLMMIDFGSEQVFRARSTYTCLCFINKINTGRISYVKCLSTELLSISETQYTEMPYETTNKQDVWLLQRHSVSENIRRIENTGIPLGKLFLIKNGFATLKNEIYLFSPESQSDNTFTFQKNGIRYEIEKRICRPAVKPNILKNESDITENLEQLIFPYIVVGNKVLVMSETLIQQEYPLAYAYLSDFKIPLSERDKGNRKYEEWFAFGRSQALDIKGYKLLFPYLSDKPYFVFTDELDLLFYNGYALVSDTEDELRFIQKILKSDVFWYYIKHTSKPYGGDYFALAKNYVKNFGVYNFSNDQKQRILEIEDSKELNDLLCRLYNIDIL